MLLVIRPPKPPPIPGLKKPKIGGGIANVLALLLLEVGIFFLGRNILKIPADKQWIIWATMGAVLLVWLTLFFIQRLTSIRASSQIEKELKLQAAQQMSAAGDKNDVQRLQDTFNDSLRALKGTRMGKSALFTLPWYVIIGPPGSGKSTALQESGLNFPSMGQGPRGVKGIGGTRNCDWWFTDEAIFLDTAGRYTTETDDQPEWFAFLDLVKKARKINPINGVLVAVSVTDIISMTPDALQEYAQTIRDRLDELCKKLQVVFPIYLVFTKCDLLTGFVDFFGDFDKPGRDQVWGCTLEFSGTPQVAQIHALGDGQEAQPQQPVQPQAGHPASFSEELAKKIQRVSHQDVFEQQCGMLYQRLYLRRLHALSIDRPEEYRERVYLFPRQWAIAQKRFSDFIGLLFQPNPFQETAILRGFYFTSGTQDLHDTQLVPSEIPLDQLMAAMSMGGGMDGGAPASMLIKRQEAKAQSYFLYDLFKKVIIPDQTLVRMSSKARRKRILVGTFAALTAFVAFALLTFGSIVSFVANQVLISNAGGAAIGVVEKQEAARLEKFRALEKLRKEVGALDRYDRHGPPFEMGLGLYRGGEMIARSKSLYYQSLRDTYVQPAADRILKELLSVRPQFQADMSLAEVEQYFDAMRALRMFYGDLTANPDVLQAGIDPHADPSDSIHRWIDPGWTGDEQNIANDDFKFLLDQLRADAATGDAKAVGWTLSMSDVVSNQIDVIESDLANALWFRLIDENYRSIVQTNSTSYSSEGYTKVNRDYLFRGPGRDLMELDQASEFSLIFTKTGWEGAIYSAIEERAGLFNEKYSDLRPQNRKNLTEDQFTRNLRARYTTDYQRLWWNLFSGLRIKPFENLTQAGENLAILASEDNSPLQELFVAFAQNQDPTIGADQILPIKFFSDYSWVKGRALPALTAMQTQITAIGKGTLGSRILPLLDASSEVKMSDVKRGFEDTTAQLRDAISTLNDGEKQRIVHAIFDPCIANARNALIAEAQAEIQAVYTEKVYNAYLRQQNKFPFVKTQPDAVPVAEFGRYFNPVSGTFWEVNKAIIALTTTYKIGDTPLLHLSDEYRASVKAASEIRAAMFQKNSEKLNLVFYVFLKQRARVTDIIFQVGAKTVRLFDAPNPLYEMSWTQDGKDGCLLSIKVANHTAALDENFLQKDWGVFRLVAAGRDALRFTNYIQYSWRFKALVQGVSQEFTASINFSMSDTDLPNPFADGFFSKFKPPATLGTVPKPN